MPELPEVETVVRDLRPCLVGHRLTTVKRTSRHSLRTRWRPAWNAAIDPAHRPTSQSQLIKAAANVRGRAVAPHGDERWMFAQHQRGRMPLAGRLERQRPLQGQGRLELDLAEQINAQG